jgi:hypothetical protein
VKSDWLSEISEKIVKYEDIQTPPLPQELRRYISQG